MYSYVSALLCNSGSLFHSLEAYVNSGCVPRDDHEFLNKYTGSFVVQSRSFASEYCSHLASGNDAGFNAERLAKLNVFIASFKDS